MKKLILSLSIAGLCTLPLAGQAAAYKETIVTTGGTVSGTVNFSGKDLPPKIYSITKDNNVCGTGNRKIDYVRVVDGHLMDTVVYLDKVKEGKAFEPEQLDAKVDQKGCEFKPFLQAMKNGTQIAAVNEDPILHNIHTYEIMGRTKKTVFNVSQPDPGTVMKTVKLKRGTAMKVECDAHDFMHGFVFVAKNPYFAIVDDKGNYSIENVPPGKYTTKVWHGTLKGAKEKVEVSEGKVAKVDFDVKK
jgi:plastocyanin